MVCSNRGAQDGTVVSHFGPGMEAIATQTAWDPPRRFAAEGALGPGPDAPTMATEWIVEGRSGGTCVVRVVHSLFANSDDWDEPLESIEAGWPDYFRILELYLLHFRGRQCSNLQVTAFAPEPASTAWEVLTRSLGLENAASGERRSTTAGGPRLAGLVELTGQPGHPHQLLLRLDEPAPGIAHLFALSMCGQVCVVVRLYLYGSAAPAAVSHEEPRWQALMNQLFPPLAMRGSAG